MQPCSCSSTRIQSQRLQHALNPPVTPQFSNVWLQTSFPDTAPLDILYKMDCHASGGGKTIPVPKQGSTVILPIYPKQDLTFQVLKAPCLCTVRGVLISSVPLKHELGGSSLLSWFWRLSPAFSKPVQLSHHLRTGPQLEVFSVAAASWDIWPPECIPLGLGKRFGGSRR